MKIDAHQQFWRYDPAALPRLEAAKPGLRRDFLPQDLRPLLHAAGIGGSVAMQARQSVEETDWLLGLADQHEFVRGVVGWLPLTAPDLSSQLQRCAGRGRLKGVRHQLQDEADTFYMLRQDFNRGIDALREFGLVYDILVAENQLEQTIEFVDRHPGQVFVLDHMAQPRIEEQEFEEWRANMEELARRHNLYCKISGIVTEVDWRTWATMYLRPYFDTVLNAFTPNRLLFGSDWPSITASCPYPRWVQLVEGEISDLSADERGAIMGGNAIRVYRL